MDWTTCCSANSWHVKDVGSGLLQISWFSQDCEMSLTSLTYQNCLIFICVSGFLTKMFYFFLKIAIEDVRMNYNIHSSSLVTCSRTASQRTDRSALTTTTPLREVSWWRRGERWEAVIFHRQAVTLHREVAHQQRSRSYKELQSSSGVHWPTSPEH